MKWLIKNNLGGAIGLKHLFEARYEVVSEIFSTGYSMEINEFHNC